MYFLLVVAVVVYKKEILAELHLVDLLIQHMLMEVVVMEQQMVMHHKLD